LYTSHTGIFNIYGFGTPDPTGIIDSSSCFIMAASAASANGGGIVFAPPGNYKIAVTIALDNYTELVGSDQRDTVLIADEFLAYPTGVFTTVMVTNPIISRARPIRLKLMRYRCS
jgi:Pectate lyase superfamily protein